MSEFQLTQSVYQNRQELRISRGDFDRYLAQVAQSLEAEVKRLRDALGKIQPMDGYAYTIARAALAPEEAR